MIIGFALGAIAFYSVRHAANYHSLNHNLQTFTTLDEDHHGAGNGGGRNSSSALFSGTRNKRASRPSLGLPSANLQGNTSFSCVSEVCAFEASTASNCKTDGDEKISDNHVIVPDPAVPDTAYLSSSSSQMIVKESTESTVISTEPTSSSTSALTNYKYLSKEKEKHYLLKDVQFITQRNETL